MNPTAAINVSPHLLADVLTCETRAWLRHVRGYTSKGEAIKAVAGRAFHAAIAAYLAPTAIPCSPAVALEAFHQVYDPAFARLAPDKLEPALTPANLHRVLSRWIEMHPAALLPWRRVLKVEEAFVSHMFTVRDITVRLIVRPDLVVEDADGRVRWVDTKTTGWRISDPGWRRNLKLSLQVQLYTDAVQQRCGDRAALGGWGNAIEMRQLPHGPSGRKGVCKTHQKPFSECAGDHICGEHQRPVKECSEEHSKAEFIECMTTEANVARALIDAQNAAEAFICAKALEGDPSHTPAPLWLNMNGTANGACRFCFAAEWCEASRPMEGENGTASLDAFFIHEPWVIEEGKRE